MVANAKASSPQGIEKIHFDKSAFCDILSAKVAQKNHFMIATAKAN
jgi:hypothetical protein